MTMISPVSDLRNYKVVLDKVEPGSPVFLTVNGHGRYTIRDIADDEEFEQTKAMLELMMALYDGRQSGLEQGYTPSSMVRERLKQRLAGEQP